jgi:hypothetical protein
MNAFYYKGGTHPIHAFCMPTGAVHQVHHAMLSKPMIERKSFTACHLSISQVTNFTFSCLLKATLVEAAFSVLGLHKQP